MNKNVKTNKHDFVLWAIVILLIFVPLFFNGSFKKLPQPPSIDNYLITAFRN